MLTTYDLVWMAAERAPDHPAIVDDRTDRRLTYRQLMAAGRHLCESRADHLPEY